MAYAHRTYELGASRFHELSQTGWKGSGITGLSVSERGFIINSESAQLERRGTRMEIMQGQRTIDIAEAFKADPAARLSAGNDILMLPWANRMIGEVVNRGGLPCVKVDFMDQTRYVPVNLDPYRLHGLAYANEYHDVSIHNVPFGGIALTGTTKISRDQWFSDFSLQHTIELYEGTVSRTVDATNVGDSPAPISIGEHPYFRIPDGQPRSEIVFQIPGIYTILLGEDGNPDFSNNPIAAVANSPLAGLFTSRGRLRLGDSNINNSFLGIDPVFGVIEAGVEFKAAGYGVYVTSSSFDAVNVVHAFAPYGTPHPAEGKAVAIELQGNLLAPLDERWYDFSPLAPGAHIHPSGMRMLYPGESMRWRVLHAVREIG